MMKSRRWPSRSWIPSGGWSFLTPGGGPPGPLPEPQPLQKIEPPTPWPPPPADFGYRPPPPPDGPPETALASLTDWKSVWLTIAFAVGVAGLIWSAVVYAGSGSAEIKCVALSSVGPGVGFSKNRILWGAWACKGDDGLWRWSHPASWDPVTVSAAPPVEVKP